MIVSLFNKKIIPLFISSNETFFFICFRKICFLNSSLVCFVLFHVGPGAIALTLILGANESAKLLVKVSKADLLIV